jgi:prolipoprotein diacylglyceryltransferase
MFPILHIGPAAIQAPGLILLLGVFVGSWVAERYASRHGVSADKLSNLMWISLGAGVLGARLGYVAQHPSAFASDPLSLINPSPALLDLWSGLAIGLLAGAIYGQRKTMPVWPTLDALTPALAVLGVAIGLSHLASGEAYGAVTASPISIFLWGAQRYPTQIYEMLAAAVILAVTWPLVGQTFFSIPGTRFLSFVIASAAVRLVLEALRGDSFLVFGGIRLAQVTAWVVLAVSLWMMGKIPGVFSKRSE